MKGSPILVLVMTMAVGNHGAGERDSAGTLSSGRTPMAPAAGGRVPHHSRAAHHGAAALPSKSAPGVAYRERRLGLATAHVVQVDLGRADVHVTVGVANGGVGRGERWQRIIHRLHPTAAITGTYYDVATLIPVGTIIANGIAIHRGSMGTALTFTAQNQARLTRCGSATGLHGVQTALEAGPRLLDQGHLSLSPAAEGFHDPGIFVRTSRAAVGLTKRHKLLLVTVAKPLDLREMAQVMRALGASDALCMDGGSSTGLYCSGKSYQVPSRTMTNLLVVYAGPGHRSPRVACGAGQSVRVASRA